MVIEKVTPAMVAIEVAIVDSMSRAPPLSDLAYGLIRQSAQKSCHAG